MKKILAVTMAVLTALIVLAGYFFQDRLSPLLGLILDWGILLAGAAGLIGVVYLLRWHLSRLIKHKKGRFHSLIVLCAFLFAFIMGFVLTPQNVFYRDLILNVQVPVEASLLAILAVTLLYTSLRLIRVRGWSPMAIAFLISALVSLTLDLGFIQVGSHPVLAHVAGILERLPAAGARGILMGMALGGLVVGLRVLLTMDRPYGE